MSDQEQHDVQHDELHVYEANRTGLPPVRQYVRDLVQRWPFAAEYSRSSIRAASTDTLFGRIWLVLNPTLLACVYFLLVVVLSESKMDEPMGKLSHICCGLFIYFMNSGSIAQGANSVIGGGSLMTRMAFPRLLMPFGAVRTAFYRFLPTLPIYFLLRLFTSDPWTWRMLLAGYFLFWLIVFASGMAALLAALTVYFRDTTSFLPYLLRIWLYLSPVIWPVSRLEGRSLFGIDLILLETIVNPMFSIIGGWSQLLQQGTLPDFSVWLVAALWSTVAFFGGCLFFMSREREFAVRL